MKKHCHHIFVIRAGTIRCYHVHRQSLSMLTQRSRILQQVISPFIEGEITCYFRRDLWVSLLRLFCTVIARESSSSDDEDMVTMLFHTVNYPPTSNVRSIGPVCASMIWMNVNANDCFGELCLELRFKLENVTCLV